jgi:phage tail-like protein
VTIVPNGSPVQPPGGSDSGFRRFGLSMRFTVSFTSADGIDALGEWSSCTGLKVKFGTETVKQGGDYDYEVKLPTQISYEPVVLMRAMEPRSSLELQAWLGRLATIWANYGVLLSPPPLGVVDIVLQDVYLDKVASWSLRNAFPTSWAGPALDAMKSGIAYETLTFEHQGFLPPAAPIPGL